MSQSPVINISVAEEDRDKALQIQAEVERGVDYLNKNEPEAAIPAFKLAFEKTAPQTPVRDIVSHRCFNRLPATHC